MVFPSPSKASFAMFTASPALLIFSASNLDTVTFRSPKSTDKSPTPSPALAAKLIISAARSPQTCSASALRRLTFSTPSSAWAIF